MINMCAPREDKAGAEKEMLFDDLQAVMDRTPKVL